ncbi:FAD-binding monooxygenase moxY [Fusarium oxysporum f. sp. albedinis]|nr:FAD-binding monooxygenase moxY [Fusarium oxysporum f. sp. albedinis]
MESSPIAPTTGIQQSPYEFLESLSLWVHPEARLLICFDDNCKHAISPNGSHPTNHLRDKHKISLSRRKGLRKVLATLDLKNPDQAAPLPDGSFEDKKLRSYDGFSCLHCKYRTINLTLIIQHYSQDLPNYPQHPRRCSRKADIETYFEYVYLQTWASGASRAYWIVERDGRLVRPAVLVGSIRGLVSSGQDRTGDEQQDLVDSVKAREYQRNRRLVDGPGLAGDTQTAAAGSTTTYAEQRPWLERTRWEITYKKRDRSLLRRLIQAPYLQLHGRPDAPPYLLASADRVPGLSVDLTSAREDEIRIDRILKVVDIVMDRCEETVHSTSRSLLCWLKSNHPYMPYSKPFTLVKHASSTTRYRLLLKKALAFCFRAYRMYAKHRESRAAVRSD